jgi:hypothetical protein
MDWNSGMAFGLALIIIFVMFLIDKHGLWLRALKIVAGLTGIGVLGFGCLFGYDLYDAHQTKAKAAAATVFDPTQPYESISPAPILNPGETLGAPMAAADAQYTQVMLTPDRHIVCIPVGKVQSAVIKDKYKIAVDMVTPDGTKGVIPMDRVQEAIKAGASLPIPPVLCVAGKN